MAVDNPTVPPMAPQDPAPAVAAVEPKIIHNVELGDIVLWMEQGLPSDRPRAAIVTDVGSAGILGMSVLGKGGESGLRFYAYRDGIRHIDDPKLTKYDREELGAWDYKPSAKRKNKFLKNG